MSISDLTIRFAQLSTSENKMEEMLKLLTQSKQLQIEVNQTLLEGQRKANVLKEEELRL